MSRLFLIAADLLVEIDPALGGAVTRFDRAEGPARQPLFRPTPDDAGDVLATACFPLVPYANRIRGGAFTCDGREIRLRPNMAGDPSPLHGQGWQAPWTYEARQVVTLDERGLSLRLSCRNLSPERMPCGLGFHPYYPCDADTLLDTSVESVWTVDADVLPVENVPATGRYDLRARRVCGQGLDNGYEGWGGEATFTWPGQPARLRLTSPVARRFQLYSPPTGEFIAAEPVGQSNCALNEPQERWADLGVHLLEQGEEATLHARYDVLP